MEGWTIFKLSIKNYMGIAELTVEPGDRKIIKFEGPNGAGKTTAVEALWATLRGMAGIGKSPIRLGATAAELYVDLEKAGEHLVITKRITGKTIKLEVGNGKMIYPGAPQSRLDPLLNRIGIDPLALSKMKDSERIKLLLQATGKANEMSRLDGEAAAAYTARTVVNRDVDKLKVKVGNFDPSDTPPAEVSAAEILLRLQSAQNAASYRRDCESDLAAWAEEVEDITAKIKELQKELTDANRKLSECASAVAALPPPADIAAIEAELSTVESRNAAVREYKQKSADKAELDSKVQDAARLTVVIDASKAEKLAILKDNLSIPGVTIEGETLLVQGKPYDDLCGKEKIEIGLRIGVALKPELRIITIADGAELDSNTWAWIGQFAEENNLRIISAVVADKPSGEGFFIMDGRLVSEPALPL